MPRINTISPERARGLRRLVLRVDKRTYGQPLGISQVALPDLKLGVALAWLYRHLHLRSNSPLTRLQREMLATVVNGKVGGAP